MQLERLLLSPHAHLSKLIGQCSNLRLSRRALRLSIHGGLLLPICRIASIARLLRRIIRSLLLLTRELIIYEPWRKQLPPGLWLLLLYRSPSAVSCIVTSSSVGRAIVSLCLTSSILTPFGVRVSRRG